MSIVRLGISENQNCSEGYEAIFGKKKKPAKRSGAAKAEKTETKKQKNKKK